MNMTSSNGNFHNMTHDEDENGILLCPYTNNHSQQNLNASGKQHSHKTLSLGKSKHNQMVQQSSNLKLQESQHRPNSGMSHNINGGVGARRLVAQNRTQMMQSSMRILMQLQQRTAHYEQIRVNQRKRMNEKLSAVSKVHGGGFRKPRSVTSASPHRTNNQQPSQKQIATDANTLNLTC